MGNHGIRISSPGNDVKTCSDLNTIVNSKYANLKETIAGEFATFSVTPGNTVVKEVTHNLGYIPFAQVFYDITASTWKALPYAGLELFPGTIIVKITTTSTKLSISVNAAGTGTWNNKLKYFIYLDKGKL